MQEVLQRLIELQAVERRIATLQAKKKRAPELLARLEKDKSAAEAQLEQKRELLRGAQERRRQLEQEVEELEGRVAKSKKRLLEVKSNKEYQALLKEIDDLSGAIREREDFILEQMELIERLETAVRKEESHLAEMEKKRAAEAEKIQMEAAQCDQFIAELQRLQADLVPRIPPDLMELYRFLQAHRSGIAVSAVNQGTCQTCHMVLPPQMYIDLQKDEQLLRCPACQRIIYWAGSPDYKLPEHIPGEEQ